MAPASDYLFAPNFNISTYTAKVPFASAVIYTPIPSFYPIAATFGITAPPPIDSASAPVIAETSTYMTAATTPKNSNSTPLLGY